MAGFQICGGEKIEGALRVDTAKNAVLPILAASVLPQEDTVLTDCPRLGDVECMRGILRMLGCETCWEGDALRICGGALSQGEMPEELSKRVRSSIFLLGPVLGRLRMATMAYPGGCEIGLRPIDLHLSALKRMGVRISEEGGMLRCDGRDMHAADIHLDYPSVGATENIIMAAALLPGRTTISNAAREPEIEDLQRYINAMGGHVQGAGSPLIVIEGVSRLHGVTYQPMPDRIATGTYLCAAAAAGGQVTLRGVDYRHLATVTTALGQAGCRLQCTEDSITLESDGHLRAIPPVRTSPYPGFPNDAQAPLMAALLRSEGAVMFVENMFDSRYRHVPELVRMGADIRLEGRVAVVYGTRELHGAAVRCTDLRGGAALAIAALQTPDATLIHDIYHIQRGYQDMAGDLRALGADAAVEV